jgi:serine phosphatase RsbU (regulator of sigma subunit)
MEATTRRFARRILLINGLLLLIVLVVVSLAAVEIYDDTRQEVIAQTEARQRMLADETARAIENHYRSILHDLDLMHEEEEPEDATTQKSTATERPERLSASDRTVIGRTMWKQVAGRVSALYAIETHSDPRSTTPGGRPDESGEPDGPHGPRDEKPGPSRPIDRPRALRPDPANPRRDVAGRLIASATPAATRLIGKVDDRLSDNDVIAQCETLFSTLKQSTVGPYTKLDGVAVNLIGVPVGRDRALAAVVPVRGVEARYLDPLKSDPMTAVWLTDRNGTTIASSRPGLDGDAASNDKSLPVPTHAAGSGTHYSMSTAVVARPFSIGTTKFDPAIVTAESVEVTDKQWRLYVETSLADVDGVVQPLVRRAIWWCGFVVVSITAILVSTAVQMIRNRMRTERMRHEVLTRELDQARRIQLAWLPQERALGEAVDVAAVNHPASHISGDFYNWFELPDGRLVVTIGDVTGHGMAAAFLMATTQLLVRNTMARLPDPGECLAEVNRQLCVQVFNGQFVTMLVLVLDAPGGHLQIATAGHPAPLIADGESFQPLDIEPQLVLGVDPDAAYTTQQFDLPAEATLLLYTDGVVECPDAADARFGNERLKRILYGRYESARTLLDHVVRAVDEFRGRRDLDDDLTLVALQLQATPASTHAVPV